MEPQQWIHLGSKYFILHLFYSCSLLQSTQWFDWIVNKSEIWSLNMFCCCSVILFQQCELSVGILLCTKTGMVLLNLIYCCAVVFFASFCHFNDLSGWTIEPLCTNFYYNLLGFFFENPSYKIEFLRGLSTAWKTFEDDSSSHQPDCLISSSECIIDSTS